MYQKPGAIKSENIRIHIPIYLNDYQYARSLTTKMYKINYCYLKIREIASKFGSEFNFYLSGYFYI